MTSQVDTYTSTGCKLIKHPMLVTEWVANKKPVPQSLQVAPTEHCNLNCKFCSVANRSRKYVFDFDKLKKATLDFLLLGIKTVEITGGGEALLYPKINQYLEYILQFNLEVGLITNGTVINSVLDKDLMNRLSWIRISANVLDYRDKIDIPKDFPGTLGFSYVWTEGLSTKEQLIKIRDIAIENNAKYVRLVPNCLSTKEQQKQRNDFLAPLAEELGSPIFFQQKNFDTPPKCYWGYFKPFLYCDEYVYPCSSTVLNPDADKQFNSSYRWCHCSEIRDIWERPINSIVDTSRCEHCVFAEQNKLLEYMITPQGHENFI